MDAVLNVWKPPGMTSHDVVAIARRLTGERRIGHAGTLDPLAEGVLVLGVGQGARVLEYLVGGVKEYCARLHLGVTTDSDDSEGGAIIVKEAPRFRRHTIERVLQSFVGPQEQLPPLYAAIKKDGQPAYRRARAGLPVERTARPVEIYSIDLLEWKRPHIRCLVRCSKGTYIRSLARDVGEKLGCGAHLCGLLRTRSGQFTLDEAVPLPLLADGLQQGYWPELIYPLDEAIPGPAIVLSRQAEQAARQGKLVPAALTPQERAAGICRAYSMDGQLVAVLSPAGDGDLWHPDKVFSPPAQDIQP